MAENLPSTLSWSKRRWIPAFAGMTALAEDQAFVPASSPDLSKNLRSC
jgi:hypothetical protein